MAPSLNDLRRTYYNATAGQALSDAEYAWLSNAPNGAITRRGLRSRDIPAVNLDFVGLEGLTFKSANTIVTGGRLATSAGTIFAGFPTSDNPQSMRVSSIIKCTKGTASSYTKIGWSVGTAGVLPSVEVFYGVGYIQGVGLAIVLDTLPNTPLVRTVLLADASMTDGTEYFCTLDYDSSVSGGTLTAKVLNLDGTSVTGAPAPNPFTLAVGTFPPNNFTIETNVVAGAIRAVRLVRNRVGAFLSPAGPTWAHHDDGTTVGQKMLIRVPAQPMTPPAIVFHLGGGTSIALDLATDTLINLCAVALENAGFIVISHDQHTGQFGNNTAMADMNALYTKISNLYGIAPKVFIWAISMGGILGARAAAGQANFPVQALYGMDPLFDLANPSTIASIATTWPAGYIGSNPVAIPATAYGSTKMYLSASAADVVVPKVSNTDVMASKLGSNVTVKTTTLGHNDASHFVPFEISSFFLNNLE
jgi:pimeloyl-ACP methyl ester carboxylesterase